MPGAESLKQQAYYAYKYNRFWQIIYRFFNGEYSEKNDDRKRFAIENGIALFDVFRFCERENSSLDSKIKKEEPNDIDGFLSSYPSVRGIILNGKKAAEGFFKFFSHIEIQSYVLPSTSPANAAKSFDTLYAEWASVLENLLSI